MIVVTSRLRVTGGDADARAEPYRRRGRAADSFPGCRGVEGLRHLDRADEFVVVTRWDDERAYAAYQACPASAAFRSAPARLREIPGGRRVAPEARGLDRDEVLS
jgi:heme-degrading monooxygenase HmoA